MKKQSKFIKTIIDELYKFKLQIAIVLLSLILARVMIFLSPFLLKEVIDYLYKTENQTAKYLSIPIGMIVGYGMVSLLAVVFNQLKEFLASKITQKVISKISQIIFTHIHSLPVIYFYKKQSGSISREFDRGMRGLQSITSLAIHTLLPSLFELLIVTVYFINFYNINFIYVLFSTLCFYVIFTLWVTRYWTISKSHLNDSDTAVNHKVVDTFLNIENVKLNSREGYEAKQYENLTNDYALAAISYQKIHSFLGVGQQIIISIGITLVLFIACSDVIEKRMTVGDLVLISTLMVQIFTPLSFLGLIYKEVKQSSIDLEKMIEILNEEPEKSLLELEKIEKINNNFQLDSIEFENVFCEYDGRQIVKNLSFTIENKQTVAIVGESGSGKSTIAKMLVRLYECNRGFIKINGKNIKDIPIKELRNIVGIVPQDTTLLNNTLAYNIGYGHEGATIDDIRFVAGLTQLDNLIANAPMGLNTQVGDRGLLLSGGERQRIGIARAILKNPAILIFDEATSALDSETEAKLQSEIKSIIKNRTAIIISHKLSSIIHVDKIFVLCQGEIIESGTHDSLLKNDGAYKKMWFSQKNLTLDNIFSN